VQILTGSFDFKFPLSVGGPGLLSNTILLLLGVTRVSPTNDIILSNVYAWWCDRQTDDSTMAALLLEPPPI